MNPILSIVVATLDCADNLEMCLRSAENVFSKYKKYEYEIIIKDCSKDRSIQRVAENHKSLLSIKYHHQSDTGIYDAWNQALEYCNGEWIYFMGADDVFIESFEFNDLKLALNNIQYSLVSIPVMYVYGKSTRIQTTNKRKLKKRLGYANPFHHQGIFHRADDLKDIKFDTRFRVSGDFDLLVKMTQKNPESILYYNLPPMVKMYSGGISSRVDTNLLRLKERAIVRSSNNIATNYPIVTCAYLAAYMKKMLSLFINDEVIANSYFKIKAKLASILKK